MSAHLSPADLERLAGLVAERVAAILDSRPKLLDRVELARQLGLGPATVERRTADGTIPSIKCGRRVLYHLPDVLEALTKASSKQTNRPTSDVAPENAGETPVQDTAMEPPDPTSAFARALRRRTQGASQ